MLHVIPAHSSSPGPDVPQALCQQLLICLQGQRKPPGSSWDQHSLSRVNAAEQINGLVWFWALEGDWRWLLTGML